MSEPAPLFVKRYLAPSDFSADQSWRLVEWCRGLGATEFTIDCLSADPNTPREVWPPFEKAVSAFSWGRHIRERMSGRTADDLIRATDLWELNEETTSALKAALPGGLFDYSPAEKGWFEDPVFYRHGHLLLGVLSHEAFAVLHLSEAETQALSEAGFKSYESLPRAS